MTIMCNTLLVVSMTFERFYSIIRPHKAASFNTVKRARRIIISIVLFSIIYNIPHLFVSVDRGRACIPYGKGMNVIHAQFYYWLSFLINFVLPFILLLVMNSVIINTLRERAKSYLTEQQGQGQGQSEGHTSKIKNTEKQIFVTLLLVTFGFLILSTPSYIFYLYQMFYDYDQSGYSYAGFYLYFNIAGKMHYSNSGVNFFLYVISGHKFRNDLKSLFSFTREKEKLSGYDSSVTATSDIKCSSSPS